jgi:hypothetical protein
MWIRRGQGGDGTWWRPPLLRLRIEKPRAATAAERIGSNMSSAEASEMRSR